MGCVCGGQREINFDDMELSLRGIHRASLEETCSELGLKGPARAKGWKTKGAVSADLSERRSMCTMIHVFLEGLAHRERLERQTGTGKEVFHNQQRALLISAMGAHSVQKCITVVCIRTEAASSSSCRGKACNYKPGLARKQFGRPQPADTVQPWKLGCAWTPDPGQLCIISGHYFKLRNL